MQNKSNTKGLTQRFGSRLFIFFLLLILVSFTHWLPTFLGVPYSNIIIKSARCYELIDYSVFLLPIKFWIGNFVKIHHTLPSWLSAQGLGLPLSEQLDFNLFNTLDWPTWTGNPLIYDFFNSVYISLGGFAVYLFTRNILQLNIYACMAGACVYSMACETFFLYSYFSAINLALCVPFIIYFFAVLIKKEITPLGYAGLILSSSTMLLGGQPQYHFCAIIYIIPIIFILYHYLNRISFPTLIKISIFATITIFLIALPQILAVINTQSSLFEPGNHPRGYDFGITAFYRAVQLSDILTLFYPCLILNYRQLFVNINLNIESFGMTFGLFGSFFIVNALVLYRFKKNNINNKNIEKLKNSLVLYFILVFISIIFHVWPFGFINQKKYSLPVLSVLGSYLVAIGFEKTFLIAIENLKKIVVANTAILIFTPVILVAIYGVNPLLTHVNLSNIALTISSCFALLVFSLIYILSKNNNDAKKLSILALGLLISELFLLQRQGLTFDQEFFRYIVFFLMILAAFLLSMGYKKMALICLVVTLFQYGAGWVLLKTDKNKYHYDQDVLAVALFNQKKKDHELLGRFIANRHFALAGSALYELKNFYMYNPFIPKDLTLYFNEFIFQNVNVKQKPFYYLGIPEEDCNAYIKDYEEKVSFYRAIGISGLVVHKNLINGDVAQKLKNFVEYPISDRVTYYHDPLAFPRAYFSNNYNIINYSKNGWVARHWLRKGIANNELIIELPKNLDIAVFGSMYVSNIGKTYNKVEAKILEEHSGYIKLAVHAPQPGVLVVNEQFHPDWSITSTESDGIVRVNSVLLGALVKSGDYIVEFNFKPKYKSLALKASVLGIIMLLLSMLFIRNLQNRNSTNNKE